MIGEVVTNLRRLKPSRSTPRRGDVFAMQLPDETHLFGRVIGAQLEPPRAPMPRSYLIYVYRERSAGKAAPLAALTPDRLLLPPVFINQMPWTKGYFETIAQTQLQSHDLLRQHCFRRWTGEVLDEQGNKLPAPVEPCGDWGLSSYRWLDDQISEALGIPRAPIEEDDPRPGRG
ncbi:immunity 26/phosphotriesterase HocA family protein [Nocardia salmonicida]|uniref:immunity 26/phosphotriesterase HocA family protein n=1 Tax=Nocardia salmonicida TaxID=53431 RepID=UPI0033CA49B9